MVRAVVDDLLRALLPARCLGCGGRGETVCDACVRALRPAPRLLPPPGVDWSVACFSYEGVARELVARAKYRNQRATLPAFTPYVVRALAPIEHAIDIVTWVPASSARLRAHGVDHAEVLARAIARELRMPAARLLTRLRSEAQTGLDARSRRSGPPLEARRSVDALAVLVIDDVVTTGGSLSAAARALRTGGARAVFAATIARTPRPGELSPNPAYTQAHVPR